MADRVGRDGRDGSWALSPADRAPRKWPSKIFRPRKTLRVKSDQVGRVDLTKAYLNSRLSEEEPQGQVPNIYRYLSLSESDGLRLPVNIGES